MKGHALALASLPRYCFPDSCCLLFISTALWLGAAASPLQYRWSGGSSSQGPGGEGSHVTGILQVRLPLPGGRVDAIASVIDPGTAPVVRPRFPLGFWHPVLLLSTGLTGSTASIDVTNRRVSHGNPCHATVQF